MDIKPKDPILLDFPSRFESERLVIRTPLPGDGPGLNEAVRESQALLAPWMPWASEVPEVEDSEINVRRAYLRFLERSDMRLQLLDKQTGELVGSSGLHRIDWDSRSFETGYWIRSSRLRQGYASEAVMAITDFAIRELGANRIQIRCDRTNIPSAEVARKCGFTLEGILRQDSNNTSGELSDTMVFSKVRGIDF
ncbi:GNAT family N-acetyltransferase [Gorillibacterium sp. CAU 1737]|uniref:GNAT family N-acetyltransferase n=1 Tax=Gorillibacterium sp. CAU 1737 TaxID=3140362 RepID=UPI0032613671